MMTEFTLMLSVSGGILIGLSVAAVFIFLDGFSGYQELLPARSILILAKTRGGLSFKSAWWDRLWCSRWCRHRRMDLNPWV